jgi:hypothetical protein
MNRMIEKIKCWLFKMWVKKQIKKSKTTAEFFEEPKAPTFSEFNEHLTDSDKKNILKDFNKEKETQKASDISFEPKEYHPEVLSETYRSEKPIFSNTLTEKFAYGDSVYRLTKKQLFFIEAALNQNTSGPIDLHQICNDFLKQKYPKMSDFSAVSKEKFKPKYHKKTIRSLATLDMIEQRGRNWYLCI